MSHENLPMELYMETYKALKFPRKKTWVMGSDAQDQDG